MYLHGDTSNSYRGGIRISATKKNYSFDGGASVSTQRLVGHYSRNQAMDGLQEGAESRGGDSHLIRELGKAGKSQGTFSINLFCLNFVKSDVCDQREW